MEKRISKRYRVMAAVIIPILVFGILVLLPMIHAWWIGRPELRVLVLPSGRELRALKGHPQSVSAVAISPSGQLVAGGDTSGVIIVWRTRQWDRLATFRVPDGKPAYVAFLSGDELLTASGRSLSLWQIHRRQLVWRVDVSDSHVATALACSPKMGIAAVGLDNGSVALVRGSGGEMMGTLAAYPYVTDVLAQQTSRATKVAFSPDGRRLAVADEDHSVRLWNVDDRSIVATLEDHSRTVTSVAFSPDGKMVASVGSGDIVQLWQASNGSLIRKFAVQPGAIQSTAFSPDGRFLGVGGAVVSLWVAQDGTNFQTFHEGWKGWVSSIAFSPDGRLLIVGCTEGLGVRR